MKDFVREFFTDIGGNFSTTRLWTNICYATCTYIMIYNINNLDWTLMLAYAGIVSGADIAKKVLVKRAI
jgi:hypothetical protein